jgi:purine-binding chemotaxis protein CheW
MIQQALNLDPLDLDKVLELRRDAGQEIVDVDEPSIKLVIFELSGEWFAFPGEAIREILPQVDIFFVPGCPSSLEGVINVRGDIESVIRLAELLGKPVAEATATSSILRGIGGGMHSGIRVDRVVDVLDVVQSAIQTPPATLPEHMRHIVSGLMQYQGKPVAILDLKRIFEDYQRGLG